MMPVRMLYVLRRAPAAAYSLAMDDRKKALGG
jgi:hypothetical protein